MKSKIASVLAAAALLGSVGSAAAFPRVVTDLAAFRSGPGLDFLPILAVPPQAVVDVQGHIGGWSRVAYAGKIGFIASSLLARPIIVKPVVTSVVVAPAPAVAVTPVVAVAPAPAPAPVGLITAPLRIFE
ncbi:MULTISPECIES: hypothetical protein [Methylosinus]|uniref:SH3 domain-containing protein n=1 Tax=Methylosinus sporium TaxID=428 RepID=A0A2U1STV1_METSR|nr:MULTISPECIES: hypothetical protein [Methylosinus]MBU3889605.1 hypothetical protein [Methylosinus sp. KRF6]PWB95047.1 hypothetical protein C5689_04470 [Methylosinus sporium]TRL36834.1 hypothetical protein FM996_03935 [Methylosinus sporium]